MPCNDKMGNSVMGGGGEGGGGGGGGGEGGEEEMKGLEGREKAFGMFLSGNT